MVLGVSGNLGTLGAVVGLSEERAAAAAAGGPSVGSLLAERVCRVGGGGGGRRGGVGGGGGGWRVVGMVAGFIWGCDPEGFPPFPTLLLAFCVMCGAGGDDGGEKVMIGGAGSVPPPARRRLAGAASGVAVAPSECLCFRAVLGSSIGSMSGAAARVEILRPVGGASAAASETLDLRLALPGAGAAGVAMASLLAVPEILLASDLRGFGMV